MNAKLNKILSVFLSLIILLSSLTMMFISADNLNFEYYVKIGGTGNGSSYANAAGSIPAVVETINSDGHKAGDNVTVYIDSRNGSGVVPSKVTSAADVIAYHSTDTPIHTATITYKPYDLGCEALLGYVEYGNTYNQMFLSGPTVFEDLTMIDLSKNDFWYGMIYNRGYSVTYRNINWKGISASTGEITNQDSVAREYYTGNATNGTALSCSNEQRVVWGGAGNTLYRLVLGSRIISANSNENMHTVNGNLTLELSNTANKANAVFLSHVEPSTNLHMTYKGNVNIVMKNGCYAYLFYSNGAEDDNGYLNPTNNKSLYPVVEGAIQVVANAGSKWNHDTYDFTAYTSSARTSLTPVYKIKNNDNSVVIDVTNTAGEYTVSGDKTVYVARGDKIYYGNKNINLKVPSAEEYVLTSANDVEDIKANNIPMSSPSKVFIGWEDDGNGTLTANYDTPDVVESKYYIAPGGKGDGRSSLAPASSVERVIKSINEDGLGFGDTATVYIDGSTQPNYWNSANLNGKFIQFNSSLEHTATIVYTSLDVNKPAKIAFVSEYGGNGGLYCLFVTGPTIFKDVYLIDQQDSIYSSRTTYLNGNNVTFQNVKFLEAAERNDRFGDSNPLEDYRVLSLGGYWWSRWNIDVNPYGIGTGGRVSIDSSVLVKESGVNQIIYGWDLIADPTVQPIFNNDTTLETNGGKLEKLYLTSAVTGVKYSCMTYNKNVNLVANNETIINTFTTNKQTISENAAAKTAAPVVKGAIQIVLNDGSSITDNSVYAYKDESKTDLTPVYMLSSKNNSGGSLDVTDTAGVYEVTTKDGYYALAQSTTSEASYKSVDGILTVPAGNYTVTYVTDATHEPINKDYYIAPEGTGDGKTAEKPAGSVERVIKSINEDGLIAGDTATVYIDGANQPNYWNSDDLNSKFIQFNSSYEHSATIIYTSLNKAKPAKIAFVADYGGNGGLYGMFVTGPTVFKDVYLIDQQDSIYSSRSTYLNGHNVTFQNVKFLEAADRTDRFGDSNPLEDYRVLCTGGYWWSRWNIDVNSYGIGTGGKVKIDSTVLVKESGVKQIIYGWDLIADPTVAPVFNKDATLETNGGTLDELYLTSAVSGVKYSCMTYNKNVNLVANNETVIKLFKTNKQTISEKAAAKTAAPIVKGAIQIILNDSSSIADNTVYAYKDESKTDLTPVYVLSSKRNSGGSLDVTDTEGVYKVTTKDGYYAVAQSTTSEDSYKSVDGVLTVPAGEYIVTYVTDAVREPKQKDYYIVPEGTGDGRTKLTPAGSVEAVIKSVNEDELIEGDTATVYIDGANQPDYWNSDDLNSKFIQFNGSYEHNATIVYTSLDKSKPAKIAFVADFGGNGGLYCLFVTGPTVFKDVYLIDQQDSIYSSRATYLNGNNVTFQNVKFLEAYDINSNFGSSNSLTDYRVLALGGSWWSRWNIDINPYGIGTGGRVKIDSSVLARNSGVMQIIYGWDLFADPTVLPIFTKDTTLETNGGTLDKLYITNAVEDVKYGYMTYNKNVNLVANNETIINTFETNKTTISEEAAAKTAAPVVKGAIQIVLNDGSSITDNSVYAYKDESKTDLTPVYILSSKKNSGGSLDVTDTAGVYKVTAKDGYYAVAQSIDGDGYYISENGLLTVPTGKYKVTYTDSPLENGEVRITVDGKTINGKFRKGSVYTLPAAPAENDDYYFIGYVFNGVTYNPGDKYKINITTGVIDFVASYKLKPQMCYFTNGGDWKGIGHPVNVTVGETYRFEYSVASTFQITPLFTTTGNRYNIMDTKDYVCVEKTEYSDYYHAIYEITIPDKTFKGYDMTEEMICSLSFPANSSGFVFDFSCYNVKDPKTELIDNNDFTSGLDGWMFDWLSWFVEGNTGLGLWEWNDGNGRSLEVMKRDLEKIIIHYDDSHFDDGVWWDESDVYEEYIGNATLCGTLKNGNGLAMKNIKLLLESQEETYTTKTNSKGYFEFSNIVPGFYQLYTVNNDGEMFYTGFVKKIEDKDNYKLEIVCNSSENLSVEDLITEVVDDSDFEDLETDISGNDNQTSEEIVASVGHIKGTVYTPDIKTVPNLKIFIGDICEVVTDSNGCFKASDIPVGEYEVYTIDEKGNKYVFRTITIKENVELSVKLKYDIMQKTLANDKGVSSMVIISIVVGGVLFAALVAVLFVIVFKKKKKI